MWNERYDRPDYVFGKEPNSFLVSCAPLLKPGAKALAVADGEGRNGAWLASQGLDVTAFDYSANALRKAGQLAAERGVSVDLYHASIEDWTWEPDRFDVVAAIFIQFAPPELRTLVFEGMKRSVKPGGLILMQGYRPEQIAYNTGGPRAPEHLYTRELLAMAFADFEVVKLDEHDSVIEEGPGHSGMSALVDLIARKPESGAGA